MNQQSPDKSPPQEAELLPCPFCGGQGHKFAQGTATGRGWEETVGVSCIDCKASVNLKIWNLRAPDAQADVAELRSGLKSLIGASGACREHEGYCVEHLGMGKPCAVEEARELLARHSPLPMKPNHVAAVNEKDGT